MARTVAPARRAAWEVLGAWLAGDPRSARLGSRTRPFPPATLAPRDRAFAKDLAEGVVRRRLTLEHLLRQLGRGTDPRPVGVKAALLLGAHQLLFEKRVPARTAVHEAVELARVAAREGGARFANALLRRLSAQPELEAWFARPAADGPLTEWTTYYSYPEPLAARWLAEHGVEEARRLFEVGNAAPWQTLRVRHGRIEAPALAERLATTGFRTHPGPHAGSLLVDRTNGGGSLLETEEFRAGLFSVQDATQTEVVDLLDLQPGLRVLDLCAAPGGKSTAIAEAMGDAGEVLAFDPDPERLAALPPELVRLGLTSVRVLADREELETLAGERPFTRILVDAPCSNTGVLHRRPEARWRFDLEALRTLTARQCEILREAAALLAPGGRLVYATCSIEPEENEAIARTVAVECGLRLISAERILPEAGVRDGGGVAVLSKETHVLAEP